MHRSTFLAVLLTCFVIGSYASDGLSIRRTLKQQSASASSGSEAVSTTPGGSSSASSTAISRGGRANAVSIASTEATTRVRNQIIEFFKAVSVTSFPVYEDGDDKKKYCSDVYAFIDEELVAVGEVIAEVYSVAIGEVRVEGEGEACADADTSGSAEATAFAEIIVDAIVNVRNDLSQAEAQAIVEQRNTVLASAFAEAYATACIQGEGDASAVQTVLSRAIARPIATLAIFLFAEVDCSGEDGFSEAFIDAENTVDDSTTVDSTSDSNVNGDGTASAGGSGTASTQILDVTRCSGLRRLCCRPRVINGDSCTCSLTSRARCDGKKADQSIGVNTWDFGNGQYCAC